MTKPLTQPFNWVGSKVRLRRNLVKVFSEIPRNLYVEPFGGSGAVFFGKEPERSVFNDANGALANFMREIRREETRNAIETLAEYTPMCVEFYAEFRELLFASLRGEDVTNRLEELNLTDYPQTTALAFAFFYVQNFAFSGKPIGSYAYTRFPKEDDERYRPVTYLRNSKRLAAFAEKLRLTEVTNFDWREVFDRYDAPQTLFYCDPPYAVKAAAVYKPGTKLWTDEETSSLVKRVATLKASVVFSCYDGPLYQTLAEAGFEKREFESSTSMSLVAKGRRPRMECVYIKNNEPNLFQRTSSQDSGKEFPLLEGLTVDETAYATV